MNNSVRRTIRAAIAALVLVSTIGAMPASAQWGGSMYGVAEVDTDQTLLLLAGISAGPRGPGLHPRIGVQGYNLSYDAGTERTNVFTVKPFVGLANNFEDGSVTASIGYAFSNRDADFVPAAVSDRGEGVVVAGGWETYGNTMPLAWQALASYNFGSESLWARGRATGRLREGDGASTRLGAELAFLNGDNYQILQPGAVLEFKRPSGSNFALGAGVKLFEGGENAIYFKLEGGLPFGR